MREGLLLLNLLLIQHHGCDLLYSTVGSTRHLARLVVVRRGPPLRPHDVSEWDTTNE